MCLDRDRVTSVYQQYTAELTKSTADLHGIIGDINPNSPEQMAEFIYGRTGLAFEELRDAKGRPKRTPGGARKTDGDTMDALKAETEAQRNFISVRQRFSKLSSALTKGLGYFKDVVENRSCIFHARFNQTVTATHRLSSTGIPTEVGSVQLTNIDRGFKSLFRSREDGWVMLECDAPQLEFRVAAFLSGDEQARRDILNPNWDAHVTSASYMEQVSYDELYARYKAGDKQAALVRQDAKPETFKPLYGGEKGTDKQERWYKGFRERYSGLAQCQSKWASTVSNTKCLRTPWGLQFFWPRAKVNNWGNLNVRNVVYNIPIQSLATAEIVPIALVYLWHSASALRATGLCRFVNTVHDSVIIECHRSVVEELKQLAKQAFTVSVDFYLRTVYNLKYDLPLGVGMKAGEHWGEGKEETYNWMPNREEVA
jgi:DNA polymerase I-like protein with 3'-5' exonuclease and polymerase domains